MTEAPYPPPLSSEPAVEESAGRAQAAAHQQHLGQGQAPAGQASWDTSVGDILAAQASIGTS